MYFGCGTSSRGVTWMPASSNPAMSAGSGVVSTDSIKGEPIGVFSDDALLPFHVFGHGLQRRQREGRGTHVRRIEPDDFLLAARFPERRGGTRR